MTAKKLEIFIIVAIIAIFGIIYALIRPPVVMEQNSGLTGITADQNQAAETTVTYRGVEGKTALELLRSLHSTETQEFSGLGEFVTSIDGVSPASNQFWAFYVDGAQAQVGASDYVTKDGEKIEWKLEEIK